MPKLDKDVEERLELTMVEVCDWFSTDIKIRKRFKQFLAQELELAKKTGAMEDITGETSDGYHTFNELYEFRKLYNAALFNEWANQGKYSVHKSTRHHDGEACFCGGWFIVMATLPTGQISNHYEMKDWDLFQCDVFTKSEEWDGHTAQDVLKRLNQLTNPSVKETKND